MQRNNSVNNIEARGVPQITNEESFKAKHRRGDIKHHFVVPWELNNDDDSALNTKNNHTIQ